MKVDLINQAHAWVEGDGALTIDMVQGLVDLAEQRGAIVDEQAAKIADITTQREQDWDKWKQQIAVYEEMGRAKDTRIAELEADVARFMDITNGIIDIGGVYDSEVDKRVEVIRREIVGHIAEKKWKEDAQASAASWKDKAIEERAEKKKIHVLRHTKFDGTDVEITAKWIQWKDGEEALMAKCRIEAARELEEEMNKK